MERGQSLLSNGLPLTSQTDVFSENLEPVYTTDRYYHRIEFIQ